MTQKWQCTNEEGEVVEFADRPHVIGSARKQKTGEHIGKWLTVVALSDNPASPNEGAMMILDIEVLPSQEEAAAWIRKTGQYWLPRHGAKPVGPQIPFKIVMPMQVADSLVESVLAEPVSNREAALKGISEMFLRIVENGNGEFSNDGRDGQMVHADDVPEEAKAQLEAAEEAAEQNGDTVEVMTFDTPAEFGAWLRERVASNG